MAAPSSSTHLSNTLQPSARSITRPAGSTTTSELLPSTRLSQLPVRLLVQRSMSRQRSPDICSNTAGLDSSRHALRNTNCERLASRAPQ